MCIFTEELPEEAKWRRRLFPVVGRLLMLALAATEILLLFRRDRFQEQLPGNV